MFREIAYSPILGFPTIMWGGLSALVTLLLGGYLGATGSKWHTTVVRIGIVIALGHGILGILMNMNL